MGPYMLHFSMNNWIYPIKDYIGETGCYLMTTFKATHLVEVQLQSFFISLFRFVCLFHSGLLQKIKLSPNVRDKRPTHLYLIFEKILMIFGAEKIEKIRNSQLKKTSVFQFFNSLKKNSGNWRF